MGLKIAVNTRVLLKDKLEGIGWFTHEILRHMVQNHPNDEFFFFFDRPYDPSFIFGINVKPIVIRPQARHPLLYHLWFDWQVPRYLKKVKADVFLSMDNIISLGTETPQLLVVHDLANVHNPRWTDVKHRKYYEQNMSRFIHKARRIIAVSNFTKKDIINTYNVLDEKVKVVYNSCRDIFYPVDQRTKKQIKAAYTDGAPYIIYIGAIHPRKNIERLVQAFNIFKKSSGLPHKLILMGRKAWDYKPVFKAIAKSAFKKDIIHLGYVNEDFPELLGAADLMAYVSLFEGFGVPILEAMYSQVPVLCSATSSMPEVGGDAVMYCNPEDVNEIASKMELLVKDMELREKLITKGIEQREKFMWQKSSDSVYRSLIDIALKERK